MSKKSKRLRAARELVETDKEYSIEEAVELAKKTATTKFSGSVEVHFNLNIDPKQSEQAVRGQVKLPHSTGKVVRVAAFVGEGKERSAKEAGADVIGAENLINEIRTSGKTDFDIAVAEPSMMPKLATIAKILGPRGLMPNPRTGTVTEDIGDIVGELKAGRIDFKNDDSGNVHGVLGKVDQPSEQLVDNFNAFYTVIKQAKPAAIKKVYVNSISVNSTMGPGIKVLRVE